MEEEPDVFLLFWNIKRFPAWAQLLLCSACVFVCYLTYGYLMELIFRTPGFETYGWYLTLYQFGLSSLFSILHRLYDRDLTRRIPLKTYGQLAFYQVVTIGFSNAALGYINYPSQVIFKSCKLIPVLIGGILIQSYINYPSQVIFKSCKLIPVLIGGILIQSYINYPSQVIFKSCKLIPVLIGGILIQSYINYPSQVIFKSCKLIPVLIGGILIQSYINYPSQVIFKSCKLIPVLIGGILIQSYINYPSQVIFKSCKLIPVLIGGILIQKKKYGFLDFFAAGLMSFGLIMFTLANNQVQPNFDPKGYVMICTALLADAVIGNVQEKTIKAHDATNDEVILYTYTIGFVYIFGITIGTGVLVPAFQFCWEHPVETYGYGLPFTIMGYFGINIVLTLIRRFGALVAVTVTTCRKAVSICISFLVFAKPFTFQYVWSGMLILLGIYLNVYSKNQAQVHEALALTLKAVLTAMQRISILWRKDHRRYEGPESLV